MKIQKKHIGYVAIGIATIIIITLLVQVYHLIELYRNEQNADAIFKGILQLEFQRKRIVQIKESNHLFYLTRNDLADLVAVMKTKGWEYDADDRMGARITFKNTNGDVVYLSGNGVYSSGYVLWAVYDSQKFIP